ncbi:CocE/NonD family hydrolase [Arthrobacter castelli]|uniref:CocE/NonD family hydrolase n=1 Tax=Arthrobacter castelli TaxID=271431 RepID=UPI0003FB79EB|nr:CocE/NonD family hydrolase [Arthrobacter castelli]
MKYLDPLPRTIVTEDAWIPMPNGVRLHARIWRPEDSTAAPVPGLLEYLPYRLDDWTAPRDSERHPYYAGHGYASIRVDIRGTGSSDGHFDDEYSQQEQRDGLAVIEWIAAQPWCDGSLGMFGISWGGFNSLQLASHAPEALKAIVTVCSSDDRYDNDVHYMGGAMLGIDMASWAGTMFAFNSRPPRPDVVGDRWVEQWRDRLQSTRPMGATWLSHQERDDYWRQGSVCEDYSSIKAPVLAVGGWHDPYRDTVLRLLENLESPARGIIGPWSHQYPDRGLAPGPGMGFLQETVRWWDRWLKGVRNGADAGPQLRAYMPDAVRPATYYEERPGRWVGLDGWPSDAVTSQTLRLADAGCNVPVHQGQAVVKSPQHTGMDAGRYFPYGNETDLPPDQRSEDGRSASFDFAPLTEPVELLGKVKLRLKLASDQRQANVVARLCDVAPDGSSTLVTRGVLNLNKRNGRHRADPMPAGESVDVIFDMVSVGYAVPAGHTLRLATSSAYWPWVWPHAEEAALTLDVAECRMELPAYRPTDDTPDVEMGEPEQSRPLPIDALAKTNGEVSSAFIAPAQRSTWNDAATGEWVLDVDPGYG